MTTIDRSDQRARAVFWTLSFLGAASLVWRGRPQWFAFDDWTLLVTRRNVWETDGLLDLLLLPHNEHLLPGLTLWDLGLTSLFGIDSYLPWTLTVVAALVLTALVLRRVMLALGVSPLLAAVTAPVVMVWPDFGAALTWAPETVFILYLALGLAHLVIVSADEVDDRRAALGALLSAAAILFHSGAALTTGVVVLVAASARKWRVAVWSAAPLVPYGLWLVTWGRRPELFGQVLQQVEDPFTDSEPIGWLRFAATIAGQGFRFLAGSGGWVLWLLAVGAGCLFAWRRRATRDGRVAGGLAALSVLGLAAVTVSRSGIGALVSESPQSRYSVLVVMPLLPLLVLELGVLGRWITPRLGKHRSWTAPVLVVLASALFATAVVADTSRETHNVAIARVVRRTMNAIVSTPATRDSRGNIGIMPVYFDLDVAGVWKLVDWGWFDPPPVTDPETLLIPQVRFLVAGGERSDDDEPVALRPGGRVATSTDGDGCLVLEPLADANRTAIVRGDGPSYAVITAGAENVELRASRGGAQWGWTALVPDPTTADVRILSEADVDLSIRLLGPVTFCETTLASDEE